MDACEEALSAQSDAPEKLDLLDWIETALHAIRLGHPSIAKRMVAAVRADPQRFAYESDQYLDMLELEQLVAVEAQIAAHHHQALAAYMLGDEEALRSLLKREALASATTHAVLREKAPLLATFFVQRPLPSSNARTDRAHLMLGIGGVGIALTMLALLARYGSSWAGPSSEPYAERVAPILAATTESPRTSEVPHLSDAAFELRVALLRARPCVCEHDLDACEAITAFDRSATPSCSLLEGASLGRALAGCTHDEAREALSRACPNLP